MKSIRVLVLAATAAALSIPAFASSAIGDIVKAQIIINKVLQVVEKYREATIELEAPEPIPGAAGKYLLPFKADGELTEWAGKAVNVAASKVVGDKAGDAASRALASKVPFGGVAGGLLKKKAKETTATAMLGGPKYLQKTTELSFDSLNDYALYLHVRHSGNVHYQQALAAAMALYPELEGNFDGVIKQAYRDQAARAGKHVE